jgi:hypothetical protein
MKKYLLLTAYLLIQHATFAQFQVIPVSITDNLTKPSISFDNLKNKSSTQPKSCDEDTLEYARYKASSFQAISISNGFALGQYYDAPDSVEITGATFYGWVISTSNDKVDITVRIYEVGTDSLPTGSAVRTKTIKIDTTFGGGVLTVLRKSLTFDTAFITDRPYLLTISSTNSIRTGIVCNGFASGDGLGENLMCGTVSNIWYRGLNLNISGTSLDCDLLLEPHVKYETYAEFSLANCYNYLDSLSPNNGSSPFLKHRMYNRYMNYGLGQYSYYWYYGAGTSSFYGENAKQKLASPSNRNVMLITTMYGYRNGANCKDTAYQQIDYQPSTLSCFVDTPVCAGNSTTLLASSDAQIYWYQNSSSVPIDSGKQFTTPILTGNTNYKIQARNKSCSSSVKQILIAVAEQPSIPLTTNDSICLNAKANLSASADYGQIIWWTDSVGGTALDTGEVYITDVLQYSKQYYAEANNRGCISTKRAITYANVNANNAPSDPITNKDSTICIHDGTAELTATAGSSNNIMWYDVASAGTPVHNGSSYSFTPTKTGSTIFYVEAYDGQCASTRVQKRVLVWNFPSLTIQDKDTLCIGDTLDVIYSNFSGSIRWFDQVNGGTALYDNDTVRLFNLAGNRSFYLEPYSLICRDTLRHKLTISELRPGILSNIKGATICSNETATLSAATTDGSVIWMTQPDISAIVAIGNNYTTGSLTVNAEYFVASKNFQCISEINSVMVSVNPLPSSAYNYQVNTIGNFTFIADKAGLIYSWDLGDGTTKNTRSVTYQYTKNGNFDVVLTTTGTNGCIAQTTKSIKVAGLTNAIHNQDMDKTVIWPNPSNHIIHVTSNLIQGQLSMMDALGKLIESQVLINGSAEIDVKKSNFKAGMYYLKLSDDNQTQFHKIIIE